MSQVREEMIIEVEVITGHITCDTTVMLIAVVNLINSLALCSGIITLTLNMLGNNFSRRQFEVVIFSVFFFFFPRKRDLTFHANYLQRR